MPRWYLVGVESYTNDGVTSVTTTCDRLLTDYVDYVDEFGEEHRILVRRAKYPGLAWTVAYEYPDPVPGTVALVRCDSELMQGDFQRELVTPEDWDWLMAAHPLLVGRFEDQPVA